ncbi:hypothetical protein [Microbacterium sp. X-17]|uniref:hypothetical protein n=1 Tax=Microbacterium sp. X-17 TaxID=3144404 RepID=UPI0031F4A0B0
MRGTTTSRWVLVILRIVAIFGVAAVALLGVQRDQVALPTFSVLDEAAHFDYVMKLAEGQIPAWGSTFEQETMLIADCLGDPLAAKPLDCAVRDRVPTSFPARGYSYEAQQPPLGYLFYLPGVWLSTGLSPAATLNEVRDVGGVLLVLVAGLLLFAISTQLGLRFWRTLLMSSIVLLAPLSIYAFATVSNDAATLIVSLAFISLLLAARPRGTRAAILLGAAAGVLLGATKPYTVLLPLGVLAAFLFLDWLIRNRTRAGFRALFRRSDVRFVLASAAASLIVTGAFTAWQAVRGSVSSAQVLSSLLGAPKGAFVNPKTVVSSIANLANNWVGGSNGLLSVSAAFVALNAVLLILLGVAFARQRSVVTDRARLFATAWAFIVPAFGVAWPLLLVLQGGYDYDAPARYGLLILPLAAVAATEAVRRSLRSALPDAVTGAAERQA